MTWGYTKHGSVLTRTNNYWDRKHGDGFRSRVFSSITSFLDTTVLNIVVWSICIELPRVDQITLVAVSTRMDEKNILFLYVLRKLSPLQTLVSRAVNIAAVIQTANYLKSWNMESSPYIVNSKMLLIALFLIR